MPNARNVANRCVNFVTIVAMGSVCYLFVTQDDVHPYILVPIILLPCVLPMIVSMIFKHCIRGEYFLCYLCFQWVGKESWEGGSHRAKCGDKNDAVLRAMPCLYNNLRCPAQTCRDMLKLWPRDRGGAFRCNGPDCPLLGKRVENEGFNRFTCFACDFTLCLTCAHANMQHTPMPTGEMPDPASNAAAAALLVAVPPPPFPPPSFPPHDLPPPMLPPPMLLPPPLLPMAQPPYPVDGAADGQAAVSLPPPAAAAAAAVATTAEGDTEKTGPPPPPPPPPSSPPPDYEQSQYDARFEP